MWKISFKDLGQATNDCLIQEQYFLSENANFHIELDLMFYVKDIVRTTQF